MPGSPKISPVGVGTGLCSQSDSLEALSSLLPQQRPPCALPRVLVLGTDLQAPSKSMLEGQGRAWAGGHRFAPAPTAWLTALCGTTPTLIQTSPCGAGGKSGTDEQPQKGATPFLQAPLELPEPVTPLPPPCLPTRCKASVMAVLPPMLCPTRMHLVMPRRLRRCCTSRLIASYVITGLWGLLPWFRASTVSTCLGRGTVSPQALPTMTPHRSLGAAPPPTPWVSPCRYHGAPVSWPPSGSCCGCQRARGAGQGVAGPCDPPPPHGPGALHCRERGAWGMARGAGGSEPCPSAQPW